MAALVTKLMEDIEVLIDLRLADRFAKLPLAVDTEAVSFAQFELEKMGKYDGNEVIDQGFFRSYLRWMEKYYAYHLSFDVNTVRQNTQISDLITGTYTAPDETTFTGLAPVLTELFDRLNETNSALAVIDGFYDTLNGEIIGLRSLIDVLDAARIDSVIHTENQALHLIPDEVSILTDVTRFILNDSYVKGLFSAINPIKFSDGIFYLIYDPLVFAVTEEGFLTAADGFGGDKGETTPGVTYSISFNTTTSVLTFTPSEGDPIAIDLTSLKTGGSIDMSNYIKKTGETNQAISGNLNVTGKITAGNEVEAFGA
jgi:hypothetical protein